MLQRVKEVQESDLRMVGALARNIQRVLAVTQAQIDAAAAQGQSWFVKPVVKVSDPLDNLRGGTQLVIKQNSILPGQNVMRVIYRGGQAVVVGPGVAPLSLPDAAAEDIMSLIAFGGTEQRNLPDNYIERQFIYMMDSSYLLTDIVPTPDCKIEFDFQTLTITSGARTYLGCRDVSGSNDGLRVAHISNGNFRIYGFGTYADSATAARANTRYKFIWNNKQATITTGGTTIFDNTFAAEGTNQTAVAINGWNTAGTVDANSEGMYLYSLKIWNGNGELIADYVPAVQKGTVPVVGFYDTVSETFMTATSGTFAAGGEAVPTPDAPIDIVCNNGVLKARHESGLPTGYTLLDYIESTGTQYLDLGVKGNGNTKVSVVYRYHTATSATGSGRVFGSRQTSSNNAFAIGTSSGVVSATANKAFWCYDAQSFFVIDDPTFPIGDWQTVVFSATEHTLNGVSYGDDYNVVEFETPQNLKLFGFDNNGTMGYGIVDISSCKLWDNGVLIRDFVPCKNASNVVGMYDLVNGVFYQNAGTGDFVAGNAVSDPVEVYTTGPIETIAIKDDQNTTVSTATCEDLLSIGTYTDQQEIIDGTVTRKVGVLVLDGTEDWTESSTRGKFNAPHLLDGADARITQNAICFCTHFLGVVPSVSILNMEDLTCKAGWISGNINFDSLYIAYAKYENNLVGFKQYIADQYAAGTPVIVVYPLATSTTESVTGQPMATVAGDCTAEITQASLSGLELEVEYIKDE